MSQRTRVALLHTGAVVIPMAGEFVKRELPDVTPINYLDDKIVADLGDPALAPSVAERVTKLAQAAADAGAEAILLTCSSISELAAGAAEEVGLPILRIDEAMADEAVATGDRISVLATLATTSGPTTRLIEERAALAGRTPTVTSVVVDGAFDAVVSGDRPTHDRLVAAAIERAAADADVVVLAQASMASAADAAQVDVPVLTSLESGVKRFRSLLESSPARD
ncbi:aspartate/glutamate racemase family protein [Herbiconiux sp. SYSU D00978]|uniref:aspartate/glutamate racemase family protein n=1 Tax=Herbiconiux sp. SYSU D00978 TaxID=2812562 RepID=UPI001A96435D|nr:aspartate/glutamate racemase family protein [Herbiconiux sp. SYSU D00978]